MQTNAMKVGARNNADDMKRLQQIHDLATENGAMCKMPDAGKSLDRAALKALAQKYAEFNPQKYAATEEGYDISQATQVLNGLAFLAIGENEADEPQDVKELCALMRGLIAFITGEIDEMEKLGGGMASAMRSAHTVPSKPAPAKTVAPTIAIPAYVKSLHLSLDEQKFNDVLAVKFIGRNEIRGYSNLWGDPSKVDLETEFFTNAKSALGATDFWDGVLGTPRPLTWNHAQDKSVLKGSQVVGEIVEFGDDEIGRFYSAVLERSHKYRDAIAKLISDKSLGTSSDSAPQYVERVQQKNGAVWLKTWPLFAAALTDVPCEPRMLDIGSPYWKSVGVDTKLLQDRIAEAGHDVSRDAQSAAERLKNAEREFQLLKLYANR